MLKKDEKILVVQRSVLFAQEAVQGFLPIANFDEYEKLVVQHQQFLWRSAMETDPTYKQIIPYLIFNYEDTFFMMQRRDTASEARLKNKQTLGIGGHIREEDILNKSLAAWAEREFNEEVSYSGNLQIQPLGLINDDSNAVGQVHVGFVFLLKGDSADISVKSELKQGRLLTLDQILPDFEQMESWSQFVYTFLLSRRNISAISPTDQIINQ